MLSVPDQPPFFGPGFPTYPVLVSFCRVAADAIVGVSPPTHAGFAQQYNPASGAWRDREAVYVQEANGQRLAPGIYDCRLVGNYAGLPLFQTSCCPTGSSSSAAPGY